MEYQRLQPLPTSMYEIAGQRVAQLQQYKSYYKGKFTINLGCTLLTFKIKEFSRNKLVIKVEDAVNHLLTMTINQSGYEINHAFIRKDYPPAIPDNIALQLAIVTVWGTHLK